MLLLLEQGMHYLPEAVFPRPAPAGSEGEPQLPGAGRASPGGVPRAGDDLVVIQEAAARQVP